MSVKSFILGILVFLNKNMDYITEFILKKMPRHLSCPILSKCTVYCVLYVLSRSTIEEELLFPSNTCYKEFQ